MATVKLVDFDHVTDYISREAAWNGIYSCPTKTDADGYIWVRTKDVAYMIDEIPAADAVEVLRCKDCKYYTEGKLLGPTKFCYFYQIGTGLNTADDDFCSKGERREPNLDTTKGERRDESSG